MHKELKIHKLKIHKMESHSLLKNRDFPVNGARQQSWRSTTFVRLFSAKLAIPLPSCCAELLIPVLPVRNQLAKKGCPSCSLGTQELNAASFSMFLRHSMRCVASREGSPCRRCFPPRGEAWKNAGALFWEQSCALALCYSIPHISHLKRRHNKLVLKQTSV